VCLLACSFDAARCGGLTAAAALGAKQKERKAINKPVIQNIYIRTGKATSTHAPNKGICDK